MLKKFFSLLMNGYDKSQAPKNTGTIDQSVNTFMSENPNW